MPRKADPNKPKTRQIAFTVFEDFPINGAPFRDQILAPIFNDMWKWLPKNKKVELVTKYGTVNVDLGSETKIVDGKRVNKKKTKLVNGIEIIKTMMDGV